MYKYIAKKLCSKESRISCCCKSCRLPEREDWLNSERWCQAHRDIKIYIYVCVATNMTLCRFFLESLTDSKEHKSQCVWILASPLRSFSITVVVGWFYHSERSAKSMKMETYAKQLFCECKWCCWPFLHFSSNKPWQGDKYLKQG